MTTVLIVDDDEGFRDALGVMLTLEGYRVELAANGHEALSFFDGAAHPNAVLVDLMMPVMNGWELLDVVKKDPALAHIPVAVVSAARSPRGLPSSVPFLPKPCDIEQVLGFLRCARERCAHPAQR